MTLLPKLNAGTKNCWELELFLFRCLKTMQDTINILAISNKGRSRIGTTITTAIVEQNHHDKMFIVLPQFNQCRWVKKNNDPDFRIIDED